MLVTTIGSSSGCSTSLRDSAGVYIQSSKIILLDCGEATNKFFLQHPADELDVICITHAHLDHFIGLPMLLFHNFAIRGRTKSLTIIAPKSVGPFLSPFMNLYHLKAEFKIFVKFYDMRSANSLWTFDDTVITAFTVKHSIDECYGYYVCTENKIIFYTGDTLIHDELAYMFLDCDLIIADGTWASDYAGPAYGHSWAAEVVKIADDAQARILILTHLSQLYHSDAGLSVYSADVSKAFNECKNLKRVYIAYDGMEIKI